MSFWPFGKKKQEYREKNSYYPELSDYLGKKIIVKYYYANNRLYIKEGFFLGQSSNAIRLSNDKESSYFFLLFWDKYKHKIISIKDMETEEIIFKSELEKKIEET